MIRSFEYEFDIDLSIFEEQTDEIEDVVDDITK